MKFNTITLALALILFSSPRQAVETEKIQLPDLGDSSAAIISSVQEKELGESFFRQLHAELTISQDLEVQQYIQSIGRQLVAHGNAPTGAFNFFVVMDPNINAFAGPGGYIGVNSGLILLTEAESELASVMAHEIAHVTQRHLYRSIESAGRMSIPTIAAMVASALLAIKNPNAGMAGLMAAQAGNIQFQINFTRDHEQEADRVGLNTLYDANFDPRSMPVFFERMAQATRFYGNGGVPEFLRSHPMTENRIADTRGRADTYPYRQYPDSLGYAITKAKLFVISAADKKSAAEHFIAIEQLGTAEQRAVARYGFGLANLELQQYPVAAGIFEQLTAQYPNQPQFISALARTYVESHNYEQANKLFAKAINVFPSNDAIKIDYIRSLLKSSQPQPALTILESLSENLKHQPFYFELLAQTYADLQRLGESHRYLAEYYYATGQTADAIMQIRLAREERDLNYQLLAILNERLSFFQNEQEDRKSKR